MSSVYTRNNNNNDHPSGFSGSSRRGRPSGFDQRPRFSPRTSNAPAARQWSAPSWTRRRPPSPPPRAQAPPRRVWSPPARLGGAPSSTPVTTATRRASGSPPRRANTATTPTKMMTKTTTTTATATPAADTRRLPTPPLDSSNNNNGYYQPLNAVRDASGQEVYAPTPPSYYVASAPRPSSSTGYTTSYPASHDLTSPSPWASGPLRAQAPATREADATSRDPQTMYAPPGGFDVASIMPALFPGSAAAGPPGAGMDPWAQYAAMQRAFAAYGQQPYMYFFQNPGESDRVAAAPSASTTPWRRDLERAHARSRDRARERERNRSRGRSRSRSRDRRRDRTRLSPSRERRAPYRTFRPRSPARRAPRDRSRSPRRDRDSSPRRPRDSPPHSVIVIPARPRSSSRPRPRSPSAAPQPPPPQSPPPPSPLQESAAASQEAHVPDALTVDLPPWDPDDDAPLRMPVALTSDDPEVDYNED